MSGKVVKRNISGRFCQFFQKNCDRIFVEMSKINGRYVETFCKMVVMNTICIDLERTNLRKYKKPRLPKRIQHPSCWEIYY